MKYLLSFLLVAATIEAHAATSVSQFGITWTFSADYPVGQYANGDYYVVAPGGLTITAISPASAVIATRNKEGGGTVANSVINGSMINPVAGTGVRQGFDSHLNGTSGAYRANLNVARPGGNDLSESNPLVAAAGSSIISTRSHPNAERRPALTDAAVLTVVAVAPAAGQFRPPYCGSDKSGTWNKANLNYGILRGLVPPTTPPSLSGQENSLLRPWIEIHTEANGRYFHPSNNQPDYGGDMGRALGGALISLHLNYTNEQKETLFVRLVQYGLDVYGAAANGGNWAANGGHNLGRKTPMLLAGLAFNDSNILAYANKALHNIFQEDHQTFVVDAAQLLVVPFTGDGRTRLPYNSGHLGLPEWGEKHNSTKTRDGSNWGVYYRDICFRALMGHVLFAQLTPGAVAAWNWQPFFDYYDRAKSIAPPSEFGTFLHGMWVTYRNQTAGPVPSAPVGLVAVPTATRHIALTWTPPVCTVDYQIVERSTASGSGFQELARVDGDASTYVDTTGAAALPYFFRVRAVNGSTDGANSNEATATLAEPAKIRVRRGGAAGFNN